MRRTNDNAKCDIGESRKALPYVRTLYRQFSRRHEHKYADLASATMLPALPFAIHQPLESGDEKCERLPGSCDGRAEHVLALERERDCSRLDGRGGAEGHSREGADERAGEIEGGK